MTIHTRWIQRGVLWGLMLEGLVACTMVEHPPVSQIAPDDHAAQAAWHEKEAAKLRQHAKDELAMAEAYRENPGYTTRGVVSNKVDMILHCEALAGMYTKAAEEAEQVAKHHRDLLK